MSSPDEQARAIAERVARRLAGDKPHQPVTNRISEVEPRITPDQPRARMIDFISPGPPVRIASSTSNSPSTTSAADSVGSSATEFFQFVPVAQSPWLGRLPSMLGSGNPQSAIPRPQAAEHPSEDRFGVEEAAVTELVEFFENEKKCAIDPSGKPCDHCAMCSSRGF